MESGGDRYCDDLEEEEEETRMIMTEDDHHTQDRSYVDDRAWLLLHPPRLLLTLHLLQVWHI